MSGDLGGVTGEMRGTVTPGALSQQIEEILAVIPEQVWAWDEELPSGVTSSSTVDMGVVVPMKQRRLIVEFVLRATGLVL